MINIINPIHVGKVSTIKKVNKKKKNAIFQSEKIKKKNEQVLNKEEFNIDNLCFIQEQEDDKYKSKDYNYGKAVLHLLSEYRKSVIFGDTSLKQLQEIKEIITLSKPSIGDDKIDSLIEEIDILAKVELAKKGLL